MHSDHLVSTPMKIGHYRLIDRLGQGGMGIVYRAQDTRLEREVAIKCLRTELIEGQYVERFRREALLLAKLNHPHIVQIFDFIETDDQLALVMELIDGQTLTLHLREHLVGLKQRFIWLAQIADGLAAAHERGIIHRDLKADNILIRADGRAVITDLGIAKSTDVQLTLTDHVTGSFTAMSPEQARGDTVDFKSDLFSLGILAYQLLCGAHPFGDTHNKLQTMQRIIGSAPTPPQHINPSLPAEAIKLLDQLLNKNPSRRPQSARNVNSTLLRIASHLSEALVDEDLTQALTPPLPGIKRSTNGLTSDITTRIRRLFLSRKTLINYAIIIIFLLLNALFLYYFLLKKPDVRYIAVMPPTISATQLSANQQALLTTATQQALHQVALEIPGYYLAPTSSHQMANSLEETQQQSEADEVIQSTIDCAESLCHITLKRVLFDYNKPRTVNTKTIAVVPDDYMAQSEQVSQELANFYQTKVNNKLSIDEDTYQTLLRAQISYRKQGATEPLLQHLLSLPLSAKSSAIAQTLFKDIALDLYYDSKNPTLLLQLEQFLGLAEDPTRIQHLINRYYFYATQQDTTRSDDVIRAIEKKGISGSALAEFQGYAAMMLGHYRNAIDHFNRAASIRGSANNYFNLANAYWHHGNNEDALNATTKALTLHPEHYKALSLLGVLQLVDGNMISAQTIFERVLTQNPNDLVNLNNLALTQLINKHYVDAIASLETIHQANPTNTTWLLNLADAHQLQGNSEAAKTLYEQLISLESQGGVTTERLRHLAQAHAHLGDINTSLHTLQTLEKLDSEHVETHYTAAIVHTRANNFASALLAIDTALKNGMHPIWFELAWFDALCAHPDFEPLLLAAGASPRCSATN